MRKMLLILIGVFGIANAQAAPIFLNIAERVLTEKEASTILLVKVFNDKLFASVPDRCVFTETEESNIGYYLFAVRFHPDCMGIHSDSTLLGHFAVIRPSREVAWYDVANPEQLKPYASYLRSVKNRK